MNTIRFFVSILCLTFIVSCAEQTLDIVEVTGGSIQGLKENGLTVFKGIPFAAPPVGSLRWKAPAPVEPWDGIKETKEFGPSPYQPGEPPAGKSEDCLYLNVWTPAQSPNQKLPVLVWIYGGGFSYGSTAEPVCTGAHLAQKGVIVVSIAYRVGKLGFLAHPELSAENPLKVSGNYGLLDQIAGLQWVQDNIAGFGGDPEKVTIFGESAGGISVSMLCASPLAKGLFRGAISQSGGSFGPTRETTYPGENMKTLQQAEKSGKGFVQEANVSSIAELRKLKVEELPINPGMGGAWPNVDGYVIPGDQYQLYQEGKYNDVDVLVGYNSDECAFFLNSKTPEEHIARVQQRYGQFADTLLSVFPVGENKVPKSARDLTSAAAFGWHSWTWARLQAQTGNSKVFLYYFDQHPDYPEDSPMHGYGSPHGSEIPYVFMTLNKENPQTTKSDIELSETMSSYWTNFTKYGHPNAEDLPDWPEFTMENQQLMYLNEKPHASPVPDKNSMKVLDSYFKWRFTEEGQYWAK
ncbi:carboxylesterase family protein [Echinicola jeungdonensis]|uniref:Carboxylic ester hydrolase n=1 Tax=Echinicola jeungdonensis TaxID=709343 RepID=A0ABV5J3K6_9BACT|nr:carboxylesterase family protein [Echinicola jeungdonensis]MDN3668239.1 carboxylesterase family protein [Echinicola jeungdonensis]